VKFSFIAKHRGIWAVDWMCRALGGSRGGFYAWLTRPRSPAGAMKSLVRRSAPASWRATGPMAPGGCGGIYWRKDCRAVCIASSG
jgi:hypothetical protein